MKGWCLMAKKRSAGRRAMSTVNAGIFRMLAILNGVKRVATGKTWTRLHRVESELMTAAGKKQALKRIVASVGGQRAGIKK